jgi:TolA-binding protein
MKRAFFVAAIAITSLFSAASAEAQSFKNNRQQQRINQGVRSGEMTRSELRQVQNLRTQLQREQRLARIDGRITPMERRRIQNLQNQLDRAIYLSKHNGFARR